MRATLLAVVLAVISSRSAWACDAPSSEITFVGTLRGHRVLVREVNDLQTFLSLYILDLDKNETTLFATILDGEEAPADKERLRARRWKQAQAALEKQGLALQSFEFKPLPVKVGDVELRVREGTSENGCTEVTLEAVKGSARRVLATTGYCGSSDTTRFSGVAFTPDGLHLMPVIDSACPESPTTWVRAFPIDSLLTAPQKKEKHKK